MDYKIEFDGNGPQDLTITLRGVVDPDAVARCNEELVSDARFRRGLLMLVDVSGLEAPPMNEAEVEVTAKRVLQRDWNYPAAAIAFVVAGEQNTREVLHWRAHLGGSRSRRQVFTSREDALEWLATQR